MSTVIKVDNLSKSYLIGHQKREQYLTLRDVLAHKARGLAQRFRHPLSPNKETVQLEEFWALKDINLEIKQGERVGIIGRNGAGKSTLLKTLSRITAPTRGGFMLKGRVASLLEVGTGFHPELSGRENIFLNGAVLGMTKKEIKQKFDEIVAFAEVEKFLDTPVKRYSSGMYVRLAFAVAAHLESEILIVDEVLAVGDAKFQKRCLNKVEEIGACGRTVLFVSHNIQSIRRLCERCVYLDAGRLIKDGNSTDVIDAYVCENNSDFLRAETRTPDPFEKQNPLQFITLRVVEEGGIPTALLYWEKSYTLEIEYVIHKPINDFRIGVLFRNGQDIDSFMGTDCDEGPSRGKDRVPGHYIDRVRIPAFLLSQGLYKITVWGAIVYRQQIRRRENDLIVQVQISEGWMMEERRSHFSVNPRLKWQSERTNDP